MTLKKIAKITRKIVELNAVKTGGISSFEDLTGACGYASYGLYRVLPGSELVVGEYKGYHHAWVELNDKIIDITATQFGVTSKVYIVKKTGIRGRSYHPKKRGKAAVISVGKWDYPSNWRKSLARQLKKEIRGLTWK
jgi:hypothetical protein